MSPRRSLRVTDHSGEHGARVGSDERLDQAHRVRVAATARVVLGVGEDDRPAARRGMPASISAIACSMEYSSSANSCSRARTSRAMLATASARRRVAVAAGVDGRSAVGDVGRREAGVRQTDSSGDSLQLPGQLHQRAHRLHQRRLRRERHQEVDLLERHCRARTPEQVLQYARCLRAAFRHVDVRIGAVRHERAGGLRHQRRKRWRGNRGSQRSATSAPTSPRTRRSSSPSASSTCSATIAPCRSR